ncbi:aldo/keto reductase, partial [Candidatus Pelagibacter sp.]|nr:aldo/keto reductase [Candidatus Pelagibacter sp.]
RYSFYHQIFYAIETLGFKKKINIQIENNLKANNIEELNSALKELNNLQIVDEVYLSITKSNSKEYLDFLQLNKFNISAHFSLVEREFEEIIIDKKKNNFMAVRALGRGLNNFNFNDFNKKNEKNIKDKQLELNKLISKNDISNLEARSKYILNHPNVDFCVFSTSKISHLEQLIKYEKENFPEDIWRILNNFSKITFNQNEKILHKSLDYKDFFLKTDFLKSLKVINKLFKRKMINLKYFLFYLIFIPGNIFYNIKQNIYILIYYIYKRLN